MAAETQASNGDSTIELHEIAIELHEIAIDGGAKRMVSAEADKLNLGIRLLKCRSVVTVSNLLTQQEIQQLREASITAASTQTISTDASDRIGRVCVRMPTQAAAARKDVPDAGSQDLHDPLPPTLSEAVEEIPLKRTLQYIDEHLSDVIQTLFGYDVSLLELFLNNELEWSTREPAINVYFKGGHFGIHKDNKALTILMPLSSPEEHFQGGGTAFWHQSYPNETRHAPSLQLAPKAGTALLFGGKVSHKGLQLTEGTRVVFVASFSRKTSQKAAKTWTVAAR